MNATYDENVAIKDAKWFEDDAVKFEVNISDTVSQYNFFINLRNSTDYRFQNLYIFLVTQFILIILFAEYQSN